MALRYYSNIAPPLTLQAGINSTATTLQVSSTAGYPTAPFTLGIERGTANEEVVLCTEKAATTFTVVRGYDGTANVAHDSGMSVEHCVGAIDYTEANFHINDTGHDHHTQYLRKAVLTAKGDIYVATGSGVVTRLAAGADGKMLQADSSQASGLTWGGGLPAGFIGITAAADAPTGWFLCDGSVKVRTNEPDLFTAIGTQYNSGGEAGTEFRLPNLVGRTAIGSGTGAGLSARTLGAKGGAESHALTTAEMPAHNHGLPINVDPYSSGSFVSVHLGKGTSITTSSTLITSTGGGAAHNNMQPFTVVNYIIKR